MKKLRQEKIISIITQKEIDTQEELLEILRKDGFDVTQATVSRDIKEMGIVKSVSSTGKYRYSLREAARQNSDAKTSIFPSSVVSVKAAGHMVCIKCHTGMAQAACAVLDSMNYTDIVGTIAGDDTIFVLMADTDSANQIEARLNELIGR